MNYCCSEGFTTWSLIVDSMGVKGNDEGFLLEPLKATTFPPSCCPSEAPEFREWSSYWVMPRLLWLWLREGDTCPSASFFEGGGGGDFAIGREWESSSIRTKVLMEVLDSWGPATRVGGSGLKRWSDRGEVSKRAFLLRLRCLLRRLSSELEVTMPKKDFRFDALEAEDASTSEGTGEILSKGLTAPFLSSLAFVIGCGGWYIAADCV
jgi:hypothetical protein